MPPINQPNPADRNSRLRAQKDQEESLGKLVKNFGGLISESTKFQVEKDKHNARDIITSNEDVTLLSAESVSKEVEKSSIISSKAASEFDKKINKKVPRFARDMLLSMGEARIKNFQGFRDLITNFTSLLPNKAARMRSKGIQLAQLKQVKRDIDSETQQELQVIWLEKISKSNQILSENNTSMLTQINQSIRDLIKIEKPTIGGFKDEEDERKETKEVRVEEKKDRSFLRKFFKGKTETVEEKREKKRSTFQKFMKVFGIGLTDKEKNAKQIKSLGSSGIFESLINIPLFAAGGILSAGISFLLIDTIAAALTSFVESAGEKSDEMVGILGLSFGKSVGTLKGGVAGVALGAWLGRIGGIPGMVVGGLLGGAIGAIMGYLTSDEAGELSAKTAKEIIKDKTADFIFFGAVGGGALVGASLGLGVAGILGAIVGAMIGAAAGGIISYFASNEVKNLIDEGTREVLVKMGIIPDTKIFDKEAEVLVNRANSRLYQNTSFGNAQRFGELVSTIGGGGSFDPLLPRVAGGAAANTFFGGFGQALLLNVGGLTKPQLNQVITDSEKDINALEKLVDSSIGDGDPATLLALDNQRKFRLQLIMERQSLQNLQTLEILKNSIRTEQQSQANLSKILQQLPVSNSSPQLIPINNNVRPDVAAYLRNQFDKQTNVP